MKMHQSHNCSYRGLGECRLLAEFRLSQNIFTSQQTESSNKRRLMISRKTVRPPTTGKMPPTGRHFFITYRTDPPIPKPDNPSANKPQSSNNDKSLTAPLSADITSFA